jgi:hypothetical protein
MRIRQTIFKTNITNKKCKHDWRELTVEVRDGLFGGAKVKFTYLHCPKCNSNSGDTLRM